MSKLTPLLFSVLLLASCGGAASAASSVSMESLSSESKETISISESSVQHIIITFESNGGNVIAPVKDRIERESYVAPYRNGYIFMGWYENKDLGGEPISYPYVPEEDVTLYAKWMSKTDYNEAILAKYCPIVYTETGDIKTTMKLEKTSAMTSTYRMSYDYSIPAAGSRVYIDYQFKFGNFGNGTGSFESKVGYSKTSDTYSVSKIGDTYHFTYGSKLYKEEKEVIYNTFKSLMDTFDSAVYQKCGFYLTH